VRTIATHTIQIIIDDPPADEGSAWQAEQREKRVLADLPAMLEEVEQNLTDLLPEGWKAVVTKWTEETHG
jgi:hypothetical protein